MNISIQLWKLKSGLFITSKKKRKKRKKECVNSWCRKLILKKKHIHPCNIYMCVCVCFIGIKKISLKVDNRTTLVTTQNWTSPIKKKKLTLPIEKLSTLPNWKAPIFHIHYEKNGLFTFKEKNSPFFPFERRSSLFPKLKKTTTLPIQN